MKRLAMKQLASLLVLAPLAAACAHKVETAPVVAISSINDCALIAAIGHDHYKLGAGDPARRIKLNGEDMAWTPGCDWKAMGFNLVEASGADASTTPEIEVHRPHYDSTGAEVRVALESTPGAPNKELCRVKPVGEKWEVAKCEADPKANGRKTAAPSPADATPEKLPKNQGVRPPDAPIANTQTPG